ncbi:heme peroxidase, partial [Gigaspora rosea]
GAFGVKGISEIFRIIEIFGINSARDLGLCSLNDFCHFLNLKPYSSFEDMLGLESSNNQILKDLKRLYNNNIENVELYPGLMMEKTKPANNIGSMIALHTLLVVLFYQIQLILFEIIAFILMN